MFQALCKQVMSCFYPVNALTPQTRTLFNQIKRKKNKKTSRLLNVQSD